MRLALFKENAFRHGIRSERIGGSGDVLAKDRRKDDIRFAKPAFEVR
jgi:hypothetical protein